MEQKGEICHAVAGSSYWVILRFYRCSSDVYADMIQGYVSWSGTPKVLHVHETLTRCDKAQRDHINFGHSPREATDNSDLHLRHLLFLSLLYLHLRLSHRDQTRANTRCDLGRSSPVDPPRFHA